MSAPLGLYLHIPFCEKKCPYCDFNTYAGMQNSFQAMVDALCLEMERWAEPLRERTIDTIFMGGGTPTILNHAQLHQLFATIHHCFRVKAGAEITSEANPGTVDQAKFQTLREIGVNRLSMGVQSFQADELSFLGRIHDAKDVEDAFALARRVGFDNINLDFIFGLPNQPLDSWLATLDRALTFAPEHLSLYSLIVEENTPLSHWVKSGRVAAPDEDNVAEHYEAAIERLGTAGYDQYEVSNWAKHPQPSTFHAPLSFASQHNLLYWRNAEYLGIGPGAHSHLREENEAGEVVGKRWGNLKPVAGYIKRMQNGASVEESHEKISPQAAMGETMMLGLRLIHEGVSYEHFQTLHQHDLRKIFPHQLEKLQGWGLLQFDEKRVRLTQRGLMVGNQVFMEFI